MTRAARSGGPGAPFRLGCGVLARLGLRPHARPTHTITRHSLLQVLHTYSPVPAGAAAAPEGLALGLGDGDLCA